MSLRLSSAVLLLSVLTGSAAPAAGQAIPHGERSFNEQVLRPDGQPVVPLFDGWFANEDGTRSLCFGYISLNTEEPVDLPLGPANRIHPASFDGDQPTHFDPVPEAGYRRHFCVFTVDVPADFGRGRVTWSLTLDGETYSVPGHLDPPFVLDEPRSDGRGRVAPTLHLDGLEEGLVGRRGGTAAHRTVEVGAPLLLPARVEHPADRVWVGWTEHQGPGDVTFSEPEQWAENPGGEGEGGRVTTEARFSEPGEYLVRVQAIDDPVESFEYHCCWTNGTIPVTVE